MSTNSTSSPQDLRTILTEADYGWATNTIISFPDEEGFSDLTSRWTTFSPPTYAAVISPATVEDVVKIVKLATARNIPFLATGGRHGYTPTLGKLQNGLAVDLSQLKSVDINKSARTLTIGGGVKMAQVYDPVYNAGFVIPTGSCSGPGMIAVSLGGGIGRFSGIHGMISDNLVSVRLVTADGRVVDVSETSNPDLFWGIRGAGANFGIVTSATYRLSQPPMNGEVLNADLIIPAELVGPYFKILESITESMPSRLGVFSFIMYNPEVNAPQVIANWVYLGPEDEGRKVMKPLLDLQLPVVVVHKVPWSRLVDVAGLGCDAVMQEKNLIRSIYSANVKRVYAETFEAAFTAMSKVYADHPELRMSGLVLETFSNAKSTSVSNDYTAYPWRDARGNLLFVFMWQNEDGNTSTAEAVSGIGPQIRDLFAKSSGYSELSVSVSYAHGDEKIESIYGRDKLPRLAALKKAWDPRNVFAYNHALPVQYP